MINFTKKCYLTILRCNFNTAVKNYLPFGDYEKRGTYKIYK